MPSAKLLVDQKLEDGRFVVVNCADHDVPLRTVLTQLYATLSEHADERWNPQIYGDVEVVELTIESIEVFRKSIEIIPKGYSAVVKLMGTGIDIVTQKISAVPRRGQILLSSI